MYGTRKESHFLITNIKSLHCTPEASRLLQIDCISGKQRMLNCFSKWSYTHASKVQKFHWSTSFPTLGVVRSINFSLFRYNIVSFIVFFQILWIYTRHTALYKVKVYSIMIWLKYPTSKQQWLRGCRRAERSYSIFKVRRGGREETSLIQGKRNPSKMVGFARGHQRANTLEP